MPNKQMIYYIVFGTLVIFLLIGAVVTSLFLASRQRTRQEIHLAQARLAYESELRTIESEVQEATLSHLATELHDNIGQLLTVMNLQLEKEKLQHPDLQPVLAPVCGTLDAAFQQVRLLSHSLSRDFISDAGLLHVVDFEVQRVRSLGRQELIFDTDGNEPSLSRDARIVAFRIFQEALQNALRHAKARCIKVTLRGMPHFLLQLSDDGVGFDKETALQSVKGLGLKNMERRAALAGLSCRIDTAPDQGCTYTIRWDGEQAGVPGVLE